MLAIIADDDKLYAALDDATEDKNWGGESYKEVSWQKLRAALLAAAREG